MARCKLKKVNAPRRKALFGEAAITAGAILAASAANVGAQLKSAKNQAKATVESAKQQADALKQQITNDDKLAKERISIDKQTNRENQDIARDNTMTLQILAGQNNMNARMEATKMEYKYGGSPKRRKLKSTLSYGGGRQPFKVTDGGGVIPLEIDNNGYGLYEIVGNDHEHYHKTKGGKSKTGVGIKFNSGEVVEGEGNQNTNRGELLYVDPQDALFLSKHSIDGFNPREAVLSGMSPKEAFAQQEVLKDINNLKDDGSKAKCGTRRKLKKASLGAGMIFKDNVNYYNTPFANIGDTSGGAAYIINNRNENIAKCGKRISLKRHKALLGYNPFTLIAQRYNTAGILAKNNNTNNTSTRSGGFTNNYGGAMITGGANLLSSAAGIVGGIIAGKKIARANRQAAELLADANRRLQTIDENFIDKKDYTGNEVMAYIQAPDTNINPQIEKINRDARAEKREMNYNTLSSATRQRRSLAIDDRSFQRIVEQYGIKHNLNQEIEKANLDRISQAGMFNVQQKMQGLRDYANAKINLKQYNNNIVNARIAGEAQAYADAITGNAQVAANTWQNSANLIGGALTSTAQGFANVYNGLRTDWQNYNNLMIGQDTENQVLAAIRRNDKKSMQVLLYRLEGSNHPQAKEYVDILRKHLS